MLVWSSALRRVTTVLRIGLALGLGARCRANQRKNGFHIYIYIYIYIYRVSQEECARFREDVPYVKVYRYNPKHLCPKLNGYGDNGQRKVWSSGGSTHCTS